ncbi:AB hydrolase-1 domain-containing protein [Mycena sanguinolenta]|uniref:AB hydrolase-1 domain-containing protein n=1 Tax=Mycena sanguinolenta TaxID=230812 RepID=A0A8H7D233_9AGAR|nr:AB hydrolase-1 domain-containing protein [Mycena sanguinolenta]
MRITGMPLTSHSLDMVAMHAQSYTFDPRPHYPLLLSANRYWDPTSPHLDDPTATTLIFTHGTGFHKEQIEPTIQDLYNLVPIDGSKIRDIWSIDSPNHGDSAVLNERALQSGYEPFEWQLYPRAVHALLAGLGTGIDVDFSKRRLVLIGHSMGAIANVFALSYQPVLEPEFLIMIEIMSGATFPQLQNLLSAASTSRHDIWQSRAEAYRMLKARRLWRSWDDRVLRIFVEKGMRPLPTLEYPDKEGITLKCTRKQETATYQSGPAGLTLDSLVNSTVQRFPTHFIVGCVNDHLPRAVKNVSFANSEEDVQNLASFTRIPDAGHLMVQTHPTALAKALLDVLTKERDKLLQAKL